MSLTQIISRIYSTVNEAKTKIIKSIIQSSVRSLFDVFTILIFKYVADAVQNSPNSSYLWWIFIVYSIVWIVYITGKYCMRMRGRAELDYYVYGIILKKILKKYIGFDQTRIEKIGTGKLLTIITDGSKTIQEIIIDSTYILPNLIIKIAFTVTLLLYTSISIGIFFVVGLSMTFIFVHLINKKAIYRRNKRTNSNIEASRNEIRILMSKQEILQANAIDLEIEKHSSINNNTHTLNLKVNDSLWIMFNIPIALVSLLSVYVLYYSYLATSNGTFSLGYFSMIISLSGFLLTTVIDATTSFKKITGSFEKVRKLRDFLDNTPMMQGYDSGKVFKYKQGDISFKNITFSYEKSPVFSKFSLDIQGGKRTAFVGMSGSGKSTLIKLIAGYIKPDSGKVLIDSQDLSKVKLESYLKHVGYLTQEPSVFDGTIMENLMYSVSKDDEMTQEKLEQAIISAKCEFIYEFKDGIHTEIGEKGIRLSGGQRQRLAIAKIFLKNPQIILLDEPTSALDSFSEDSITQAMHNLFHGRTVIIIAHRLQTVKEADEIIVFENGEVLEKGNHKKLISQKGYYAKMLKLQTGF